MLCAPLRTTMMDVITATTAASSSMISRRHNERGHAVAGFKATAKHSRPDKLAAAPAALATSRRRSPLAIARLLMAVLFVVAGAVACDSSRINASGATVVGALQQLPPIYGYLDSSLQPITTIDELPNVSGGSGYLVCTKGK